MSTDPFFIARAADKRRLLDALHYLFSTPARSWSLWVVGICGQLSLPARLTWEISEADMRYPEATDGPGPEFLAMFAFGWTALFWFPILREFLHNYPGRVPLWIWRKDHGLSSLTSTLICGLACAWSIYRGLSAQSLMLPYYVSVFYFGCVVFWLSLRAVVLAKLPVIDPSDLRLRGALALTPIKPALHPPIRRRPHPTTALVCPPSPACREKGRG
jgi:hypothetical protein